MGLFGRSREREAFALLDSGQKLAVYLEAGGVKTQYMVIREDKLRDLCEKAYPMYEFKITG